MEKLIPTEKQLDFMNWEFGVFFHFGIRTFYEGHKDWDFEEMSLSNFCPTELDCDKWIETIKQAGATYAILVCKHHDGFANWPSKYTEYSIKNTPWKNGEGDVVGEFTAACRRYGIKVGFYYSPAEFGTRNKTAEEYDDYFINQISELLTDYGTIDYLWFDGCGSEDHQYDTERIVKEIRSLQPKIMIFNMWDPDTRWIGNEVGIAPLDNFNEVENLEISVRAEGTQELSKIRFLPAECDVRMRNENWFFSEHDEDTVKSVKELMGLYDLSVGRGANLLLNIGPDRLGKLPKKDSEAILEFGKQLKKRFAFPITAEVKREDKKIILSLEKSKLVNCVVLCENLARGQWVRDFKITVTPDFQGKDIDVFYGKTIGHKVICSFPAVSTKRIEIILDSAEAVLESAKVFYTDTE